MNKLVLLSLVGVIIAVCCVENTRADESKMKAEVKKFAEDAVQAFKNPDKVVENIGKALDVFKVNVPKENIKKIVDLVAKVLKGLKLLK
jgi:enamine deaminase RidA (YjgF/YER057c/UK114 family)